jgi:hypothetical protein
MEEGRQQVATFTTLRRLSMIAAGAGVVGGVAALWVGLQHNPQGEFFIADTGQIDYGYCALIFGSWFGVAGVGAFVVAAAAVAIFRLVARPTR